jgi:hypothetical protein
VTKSITIKLVECAAQRRRQIFHKQLSESTERCIFGGLDVRVDDKAIPLQALTGPEGSRRPRLPDFETIVT